MSKNAKEYVEQWHLNHRTTKSLTKIALAMVDEVSDIATSRHSTSDSTISSIFKEQDLKWQAMARLDPAIAPHGFRTFVSVMMPKVAFKLGWCTLEESLDADAALEQAANTPHPTKERPNVSS